MHKACLLAVCLLLMPFTGCLDEEIEEKPSDNPEFSPPTTLEEIVADYNFTIESTGISCSEGVAQILADYELVNSFLPEGYEAISNSNDETAVSLTSLYCENWSLSGTDFFQGEVLIEIEAPNVTGIDSEGITVHYYALEFYTSNSLLADKLKLLGWNVFEGDINLEITNLDFIASSEVDSGNSSAYSYEVRSGIPQSFSAGTNRVWHEAPNGTSYWDYSFQDLDVTIGQAECFISDSIASEAAGTSTCPFDSLGVILPEMDLVQTLGWFPDTFVTKT
jgi:hypothetical protein